MLFRNTQPAFALSDRVIGDGTFFRLNYQTLSKRIAFPVFSARWRANGARMDHRQLRLMLVHYNIFFAPPRSLLCHSISPRENRAKTLLF
jgi:hypothetical protein